MTNSTLVLMKTPDIFTYLDYRKFLKDSFEACKADNPRFSYRAFAKVAGYTSPNFLQHVIAEERNLGAGNLPGTIRALGLNKQESEFFANLVGFAQAESFEEKNFHYQRMLRSRRYIEAKPIEIGQFQYYEHWYHPVVRELLTHKDFTGDPAWIAERIYPRITVPQVERSMALLQTLGMVIQEEGTGRWIQIHTVLSTAPEVGSLAVANYHRAVLKLASESIEAFPQEERDLRAVTMGIPKKAYPELKRKMEEFWRELLDLAGSYEEAEEVFQVNLQLFPMTMQKRRGDA